MGFGTTALVFGDLDWPGPAERLTGATLQNLGVAHARDIGTPRIVGFDGHSISIGLGGDWEPGDAVRITLSTAPVPLPPAIWLMGAGLGSVAVAVRRRRRIGMA